MKFRDNCVAIANQSTSLFRMHRMCLKNFEWHFVAEKRKMKTQTNTNDCCCTPAKKKECKSTALIQSWLGCIRASILHVVALLKCHRILRPKLYTLHGSYRGESMILAWALLPSKTKATYIEMFISIRSAIVEHHGDIGRIHGFITDFEMAVIEAIRSVFPETVVKGCSFHFRQAVMWRVTDEGMQPAYNSSNPLEVKSWIRKILAMCLLPVYLVDRAWEHLRNPPDVLDNDLSTKMMAFREYFKRTWLTGHFPAELWTHYDNSGPRTTNQAEGWHNSVNYPVNIFA